MSFTSHDRMVLEHVSLTETMDMQFFDVPFENLLDTSNPDWTNSTESFENAEAVISDGWTPSGSYTSYEINGTYWMEHYYGNSNSYHNIYLSTPWFIGNEDAPYTGISFDAAFDWWSYDHYVYVQMRTSANDGWSDFQTYTNPSSGMNSYAISLGAISDSVQFRLQHYYRHWGRIELDNFQLQSISNTTDPEVLTQGFSSGGWSLANTDFNGDIQILNDTIIFHLENSTITRSSARQKDSHGLGLYGEIVDLSTTNTLVKNHAKDGLHIHGHLHWTSADDIIDGNGIDGIDEESSPT